MWIYPTCKKFIVLENEISFEIILFHLTFIIIFFFNYNSQKIWLVQVRAACTLYRQVRLFTKHTQNLYYCLNYVVFATEIATAWYLYRVGNKSSLKCMDFLEKSVC